jgi:hypothetical protein
VVTFEAVSDYDNGLKCAVEIVETKSLEEAIEMAKSCPGVPYGMKVEVLEEYTEYTNV